MFCEFSSVVLRVVKFSDLKIFITSLVFYGKLFGAIILFYWYIVYILLEIIPFGTVNNHNE